MDNEKIKLPELPLYLRDWVPSHTIKVTVGALESSIKEYARQAVRLNAPDPCVQHQADAWQAVCKALTAAVPDWLRRPETAQDCAVLAIQQLARVPAPVAQAKPEPIPFDLEAAKAGAPLVTRDGRKARFLGHIPEATLPDYRVVAFIEGNGGATNHFENGQLLRAERAGDLFMAPKPKRTVWVNLYPSGGAEYFENDIAAHGAARYKKLLAVAVPIEIDA